MRLGVASAVVGGRRVPGDVEIADGTVAAVGAAPAGDGGTAVAGFVDLQVNGFGGVDFLDTDAAGYEVAAQALARTGVTAYQPTFISSPEQDVLDALDVAAGAQEAAAVPASSASTWRVRSSAASGREPTTPTTSCRPTSSWLIDCVSGSPSPT